MWQLVASVGVGCAVGFWLDKKFGWSPWALIGGSLFGMTAGMTAFLRAALNVDKGRGGKGPKGPTE